MRSLVLLLSLFTFLLPVPALAADPIVIFANDANPPKTWLENGHTRGALADILHEIAARTDLRFDIRLMPWKRAYMNALESRGGLIGMSRNRMRNILFDFSEVVFTDELRLVVLKGHEFPYRTMEDLKGKVLGVTRGASYGDEFDRAKGRIFTPSEDSSTVCRLRMLLAGRIDAALIGPGPAPLQFAIARDKVLMENSDRFVVLDPPFIRDENYIGFTKDMHCLKIIKQINKALREMREDGTFERIEGRY